MQWNERPAMHGHHIGRDTGYIHWDRGHPNGRGEMSFGQSHGIAHGLYHEAPNETSDIRTTYIMDHLVGQPMGGPLNRPQNARHHMGHPMRWFMYDGVLYIRCPVRVYEVGRPGVAWDVP